MIEKINLDIKSKLSNHIEKNNVKEMIYFINSIDTGC